MFGRSPKTIYRFIEFKKECLLKNIELNLDLTVGFSNLDFNSIMGFMCFLLLRKRE